MKKILVAAFLAFCSVALAQTSSQELNDWIAKNKPMMESGALKRSEYYKGLYGKLAQATPNPYVTITMRMANDLIDAALSLEDGKITIEQFETIKQTAISNQRQQMQAAQQQAAQQDKSFDWQGFALRGTQVMQDYYQNKAAAGQQQAPLPTYTPSQPVQIQQGKCYQDAFANVRCY